MDSRNPDTLRLSVLRNEHRRGSSRATVDIGRSIAHANPPNKNIPMVSDHVKAVHWNSFAMNKPKEKTDSITCDSPPKEPKQNIKWSISPLTKLEKMHGALATLPAAHDTLTNSMDSTDNRFVDLNRGNHSFKSSLHLKGAQDEAQSSLNDSLSSLSQESENSIDEERAATGDLDTSARFTPDEIDTAATDIEAPSSVIDFMKEITETLSTRYIPDIVPAATRFTSTRTQQKLLDLKHLMQEEEPQNSSPFANLLDYATKIQNEAILAEWNQIRHRFSSYVSSNSKKTITCQAGVLGSLRRCRDNGFYGNNNEHCIKSEEKDLFLKKLWFKEQSPSPDFQSETTPEPSTEPPLVNSPGNYSLMAKSVMFNRQRTEYDT